MAIGKQVDDFLDIVKNGSQKEVKNNAIQKTHMEGYIKQVLGNDVYIVAINKVEYTISAREGMTLAIGDVVYVLLYNGNFSKKIIDFKKPSTW